MTTVENQQNVSLANPIPTKICHSPSPFFSFIEALFMNPAIKLYSIVSRFFVVNVDEKKFIAHNDRIFKDRFLGKKNAIILLELKGLDSSIISFSYLAAVLSRKHNAKLVAYLPMIQESGVKAILRGIIGYNPVRKIFRSFGVKDLIVPSLDSYLLKRANQIFKMKINEIRKLDQLEKLTIDGVLVGDLIHDSFLNRYKLASIDIKSRLFINYLLYSIKNVLFWEDYFESHDVKAVNASHTVYLNAIPLRIAIQKGVSAFQTNATHVYSLNQNNYFAYTDFKYYPEIFRNLGEIERSAGVKLAEERIERRFSGEIGVDMPYSKKSAYGDSKDHRLIRKSSKIKVLVAPHCFFDSPHPYGFNLFPGVQEWLKVLMDVALETDYDWYVKIHPDFLQDSKKLIDDFFEPHPQFSILPPDSSHKQIVAEGINFALTMYGTIGFEYAAMGVPVINASLNNPHIAYNFNINPKDRSEYRKLLMNLKNIEHKIDVKQVYEYYFMDKIYHDDNWLFDDYQDMEREMGGYMGQFSSQIYGYWIKRWSPEKHRSILKNLKKFVDSEEYRLY